MPTVAKFQTCGEAAFFQSLLESEGIEYTILDNGGMGSVFDPIRFDVADADLPRATELYRSLEENAAARATAAEAAHPGKGFPFMAAWIVAAGLTFLCLAVISMVRILREPGSLSSNPGEVFAGLALMIGGALLGGLGLAVTIAFGWTMWNFLRRQLRGTPPRDPPQSRTS